MKNLNNIFFHQFSKLYSNNKLENKIVVYTAIFNNYDDLKDPLIVDNNVDYVCFTDCEDVVSDIWKVIKIKELHRDSRRTARLIKILGHKIFIRHKINIWIDGSFLIKGSINKFCKIFYNESISCFVHPQRNCVYDEIEVSSYKDDSKLLRLQSSYYKKEGLPKNFGLISSGVLLRNNLNKKVSKLMDYWAEQIELYSSRDQVSFSYCAWKLKEQYFLMPMNIYNNEFFEINTHSYFFFLNKNGKKIIGIKFLINWLRFMYNYIKFKCLKYFTK